MTPPIESSSSVAAFWPGPPSSEAAGVTTTPGSECTGPARACSCRRPGCSTRTGGRCARAAPARRASPAWGAAAAPPRRRPEARVVWRRATRAGPLDLAAGVARRLPDHRRGVVPLPPPQGGGRIVIIQLAQGPGGVEANVLAAVLA